MSLSDGGLYDNMGLQPAERSKTVLVSDGGAPFIATVPHGLFGRLKAYLSVMGKQAGALRKRYLMAQFDRKEKTGTYWGIDSAPEKYVNDLPPNQRSPPPVGYSSALAMSRIASIRTDLDPFSDAEIAVLKNHGYCLADVALRAHAPFLISIPAPFAVPHPDWMDENRVDDALRYSNKRFGLVRWFFRVVHRLTGWF
jgi:NTE family protein